MKHCLKFLFVVVVLFSNRSLAQPLQVVDEDNYPIPSACVFDKDGVILGITDTDGKFDLNSAGNYPLVIKTAGMEDAVVEKPTDKVTMKFRFIELPDVTFSPKDRPVMHIVAFSREYSSLIVNKDTAVTYSEYMVDYFVAVEKCKFKTRLLPHVRNERKKAIKILKVDEDSLGSRPFSMGSMPIFADKFEEHKKLVGDKTGTEKKVGKDGKVKHMWKKTPTTYMEYRDLSGYMGAINAFAFPLRLAGIKMKVTGADMTVVFENNRTKTHSVQDMIQQTASMGLIFGGRIMKKQTKGSIKEVEAKVYTETYPVSRTYLSEEDAYIALRDTSKIEFVIPEAAKK